MMKRLFIFVFSLLVLLDSAHATTVRRLSFDELVAKAEMIVAGQVTDSTTYRTSDGKLILTSYTVQVGENIKGKAPATMTVTTIGGKLGNTILRVSGMPQFQTGESAVLFLEKSGAYTTVVGLNQGKFSISKGEISNTFTGLSFPDGNAATPLKMPMAMPSLLVGRDVMIYAENNTGRTYKLGYTAAVNACGAIFFGYAFWRWKRLKEALKR